MATGDRLYVADKPTLDAVKADTTGILKLMQDPDGKFYGIKRYGVKINKNDSNPANRVTYLYDAVGLNPAKMNYSSSAFDYGGVQAQPERLQLEGGRRRVRDHGRIDDVERYVGISSHVAVSI